ncbi:MAG TPA: glycogen-binding domain-containing protein [Gemmatimonadales bacterium]|nr:glycogen-binding domain-containing protein [Gemmatimonadales bacterium]
MNEELDMDSRDEARIERLVERLDRRPVTLRPGMRTAVMARIHAEPTSTGGRVWRWLSAPRVSPLAVGGLLAAAIAAFVLLRPSPVAPTGTPVATPLAAAPQTVPVRLVFLAPTASSVAVTGDFASWNPKGIPLAKTHNDGVWSVDLDLKPGLHHYVFIVDGTEWKPDPNATSQVDDGFGQKNSVLLVPQRSAS